MIQSETRVRLTLDPWPADYESAFPFDPAEEEQAGQVDTNVEPGAWRAIRPEEPATMRPLCFVDGVRRVETRVMAEVEGTSRHGLFGSFATGCVVCGEGHAEYRRIEVRRRLALSSIALRIPAFQIGSAVLDFEPVSVVGNTPADVLARFQQDMREAEARLGEELAASDHVVFIDGPLSYISTPCHGIAGLIKRIQVPYLGPEEFSLVAKLRPGERTPLFSITDGRHDRYAWFLRIADGRAIEHPLAGIVRLETGAACGPDEARAVADFSACRLPLFASNAIRDPRAPQNLVPVGALEQEMRRRLGDPVLIRRAIERRLWEERKQ